MFPILVKIPLFGLFGLDSFPIHTYGVMVALGFLAGSWVVAREARQAGENPARALDLVFYILIAAILGSRILHVAVSERDLFLENPLHLFKIWQGGLVFYGGLIASLIVAFFYFRIYKLPALKYCDFFAPALALGHGLGRLGCFFTGCCHGSPLLRETWYSVIFPDNPNSLAPAGIPLYPTQFLESGVEFLFFFGLLWGLGRKKFDGQIFSLYLMLYAVARFGIEFLRGDPVRGFVFDGWMSTSQLIALFLFAGGLGLYWVRCRMKERMA